MTCKEQCKSEKKLWEDPNELASDHCKVNECKNEQECVDAGCYWGGICYTHMTCDIVADCTLFFPFNLFCAGAFGAEIVVDSLALIFILVWLVLIIIGWVYYAKIARGSFAPGRKLTALLLAIFGIVLFPLEIGVPIIYAMKK